MVAGYEKKISSREEKLIEQKCSIGLNLLLETIFIFQQRYLAN